MSVAWRCPGRSVSCLSSNPELTTTMLGSLGLLSSRLSLPPVSQTSSGSAAGADGALAALSSQGDRGCPTAATAC
jgi:hypothetical protein